MLDQLLEAKSRLKIGAEVGCHRTILEQVLTDMMTHAWNKMSAYVPLAHIVRRITDDHSHAHLGELRAILRPPVRTRSLELRSFVRPLLRAHSRTREG